MGAGRKTETIIASERSPRSPMSGNNYVSARNLCKSDLGGAIFGCKHNTMAECLAKQLFGLPYSHGSYVRNIEPGLPLFLFNYSDRKMHGVYEAATHGKLNLDPYAWTDDGKERTTFPAQVRIRIKMQCQPLTENQFRSIITDNYYKPKHFWFELDHTQTEGLISLFTASPLSSNTMRTPVALSKDDLFTAVPATKWKAIANSECLNSKVFETNRYSKPFVNSGNNFTSVNWDYEDAEHGSLNKTSTSAPEDREYREPDSDLDGWEEENVQGSHSSVSQLAKGSQTLSEQQFDGVIVETEEERDVFHEVNPNECSTSSSKLVHIIKELEERTAALENKQVESDLQMQQLRNVVKELEEKNQQLMSCIKKLESKLKPSTSLVDDTSNKVANLYLGSENVIYLIGGYNGTWLSALDSFSPSMDKVIHLKSMSSARSYASATVLNGNLYVFGGGDGSSWSKTVECYNRRNDEWTLCPPLIRGKGSLAGATLNDKIFAIGGGVGFESFSDVEMFDPALGRWTNHHSMLEKRFAPAAAELHGILYAVGGYDGKAYLQSAERFDPRVAYWTRLPNMNIRRGCHSMAVLNEKLYAIGGYDGEKMVSCVEVFDPRLDSWMMGEPMHIVRGYAAAAVLGDSLFVIGGIKDNKDIDNNMLDTVECYREGTGWATCDYKTIGKRSFFSAIAL